MTEDEESKKLQWLAKLYHDRPELSSSEVAAYLDDKINWYHTWRLKDWPRQPTTPAMNFGTNVHLMIELEGPSSLVKQIPVEALNADGHCKGKQWYQWKAENPAQIYLKPGETSPLETIWNHLLANAWVRSVIAEGEKEVEQFWHDDDLNCNCRCRFDAILNGCLVDWKTTSTTDARTFAQDAYYRHYDVRLALYRRGYRNLAGRDPEVYIVAIQNSGGYGVDVYRMPEPWLDDAEARLILAVDEMLNFNLKRYLDRWPVDLIQPKWSQLKIEELT